MHNEIEDEDAEMIAKIRKLRSDLLDLISEHERLHHEGNPCEERINIIAWFAHSVGINSALDSVALIRWLREYEHYHDQKKEHHAH